jgi:hypothetical protein
MSCSMYGPVLKSKSMSITKRGLIFPTLPCHIFVSVESHHLDAMQMSWFLVFNDFTRKMSVCFGGIGWIVDHWLTVLVYPNIIQCFKMGASSIILWLPLFVELFYYVLVFFNKIKWKTKQKYHTVRTVPNEIEKS